MTPPHDKPPSSAGLGVDAYGMPAVDPTLNVIAIVTASNKRQDDLRDELFNRLKESQNAEIHRIDATIKLQSEYHDKLAFAEARRIDDIRSIITTTDAARVAAMANTLAQFTDRIALLEKSQYESKGRSGVSDPMMSELIDEVKKLRATTTERTGQSHGLTIMWGYIIAAIAAAGAVTAIVHTLMSKG